MKIPLWLLALLFLGYSAWCVRFWHCRQCGCCSGDVPAQAVNESSGIPMFRWNTGTPEPDSNFTKFKKALVGKGGQGDTMLVTGWYRKAETAPKGFANMGLARAAAIIAMMGPEMPESRLRAAAQLVEDSLAEGGPARISEAFSWLKMVLKKEAGAIIESDNDVTFLFPFNSTEKDKDPAVDAYLKKLVEKHKTTTATFIIVGHTDNVGEDAENTALGLGRARAIAKILTDNGIAANRIQTSSKGEAMPVADNNTEDGRHQNRRVVITVNR